MKHEEGGEGRLDERGDITSPPRVRFWGRLQPFRGRRVPRPLRARPLDHRGPRPGVWPLPLEWDCGVLRCGSPQRARCRAPPVPLASPLRGHNMHLPCGH